MNSLPEERLARRALVTGGAGFLGSAIVRMLSDRGIPVRSFSRGDYPAMRSLGVESIRGDIADANAVRQASEGCDLVFHTAAKAGIWGSREEFHRTNVRGTENVVAACRANGISRLVHTSSPSVVFDGRDMEGANESVPYPAHYEAEYPRSKAEAERLVLSANGDALATVALRPHLIWGPGDPHLVPRLVARARSGRLRIVGAGTNVVDATYIDNAAHAHLLAAERLAPGSPVAGRVYFIAQGEPIPLWELVNHILSAAGTPPVTKHISAGAAELAGGVLESVYRLLRLKAEPPMTRFIARELATSHWFDLSAARHELGYASKVTTEEGLRRLKASFERSR